jgi:hypothetical protein
MCVPAALCPQDRSEAPLLSEVKMSDSGAGVFRRVVDVVYWTGAIVACVALVLVSAVIPWAVYTRYILNSASSWPEPMAVLLTVGITFIGSANCYRQRIHMNMTVGTDLLPPLLRRAVAERNIDGCDCDLHGGVGAAARSHHLGQFGG